MGLKEKHIAMSATPSSDLEARLMSEYISKNELEWYAKRKIETLEQQVAELSKAHTFCERHNEDDIDSCPNCTIEGMLEAIDGQARVLIDLSEKAKVTNDCYKKALLRIAELKEKIETQTNNFELYHNATIEECAKVAEAEKFDYKRTTIAATHNAICDQIAEDIRQLKQGDSNE